jgi:hypothetical protein
VGLWRWAEEPRSAPAAPNAELGHSPRWGCPGVEADLGARGAWGIWLLWADGLLLGIATGLGVFPFALALAATALRVAATATRGGDVTLPRSGQRAAPARTSARGGRGGARCGEEGNASSDLVFIRQAELLEDELVAGLREGGEDDGIGDVVRGSGEVGINAAEEVEGELRLLDAVADIAEGVGHHLHALAVLEDGRIALRHGMELVTEEDRPWIFVGAEEGFDGHLEVAGGLILALHGEIKDGVIDEAEDPATDIAVRRVPVRVGGLGGYGAVNVPADAELATHHLEVGRPPAVVGVLHH